MRKEARIVSGSAAIAVAIATGWGAAFADTTPDGEQGRPAAIPAFDDTGVQPKMPFPNLTLTGLDGGAVNLADAWRDRPTLVVATSITCPVSRDNCRPIDAIAARFGDRVNVVVVYTLEAHPRGSPSPYSDREWLTARNVREGILVPEPAALDERVAAAVRYHQKMGIRSPLLVDSMDNAAWKALGGGPNSAALIGTDGKVIVRHGWLDSVWMSRYIEHELDLRRSAPVAAALAARGIDVKDFGGSPARMIYAGDADALADLLDNTPTLNHLRFGSIDRSPLEQSPLHAAVRAHQPELARLLLDRGAEVDATDVLGQTPLFVAAQQGDAELVDLLLKHRADPAALTRRRLTPADEAAFGGHAEIARGLIAAGAPVNVFIASALGDVDEVRRRLRVRPEAIDRCDGEGRPALRYAAANGQVELVRYLLDAGARVNWPDDAVVNPVEASLGAGRYDPEMPAIYHAAHRGDTAIVAALLDHGVDPNRLLGEYRGTPLHEACRNGRIDVVRLLLGRRGVDPDALDCDQRSALHDAAASGSIEAATLLIAHGADVNRRSGHRRPRPCGPTWEGANPDLKTPLHDAAEADQTAMIRFLVERGAKVDLADFEGETPLHLAARRGAVASIEVLGRAGANLDATDKTGETPLHYAADCYDREHAAAAIKALLKLGASVNTPDQWGATPLDRATKSGEPGSIEALTAAGGRPGEPRDPDAAEFDDSQ